MRVVIHLTGGTGNQLFGYALGRELQFRGHYVQFDIEDLKRESCRMYMLDKLGLKLEFTTDRPPVTMRENSHRFDERFLDPKQDCYMFGYFQCEKYFLGAQDTIRNELSQPGKMSLKTICYAHGIRYKVPACSVHVRRTDYIKNAAFHGTLDHGYYSPLMEMVRAVPGIKFYIFSDDPDWCRGTFTDDDCIVVGNSWSGTTTENNDVQRQLGGQENEDLYLMSLCDYAIIANSTFSWWGAWLGKPKTVFAPKKWFETDKVDGSDIVPERWIKC